MKHNPFIPIPNYQASILSTHIDTLLNIKIPLTFRSVVSVERKKSMNEQKCVRVRVMKNNFIIKEK